MRAGLYLTISAFTLAITAAAWDAHTHRTVTYLALDGLSDDTPGWLRDSNIRHRIAFQSNEPDRLRGWPAKPLKHVNDPEHYLDAELLDDFGLSLDTLPELRREYVKAMVLAKAEHPERVAPYDPNGDPARTHEYPGFLLHAISEQYAALQAGFCQLRILEQLDEPPRAAQLAQARENVIYRMGILAHLVADAAQPLHTTKHYNGWVGDNPQGYTTERTFHGYIDHGVIAHHEITYARLKPLVTYAVKMNADRPWEEVMIYYRRSFALVEPLYQLERDDQLNGPEGKAFIEARLVDATNMLTAMIEAAYRSSAPTAEQLENWKKYNNFDPAVLPGGAED